MTRVDRCPRRGCGAPLHVATDGQGATVIVCDLCTRNKRGICRECPTPIPDPRALRCVRCRDQHRKRQAKRNAAKRWADPVWAARRRAQQREYNQRPEVKVRKAAFKRAWLAADPEYMRVAMRKYRESEKGRKAARRANRRYAQRHPDKIREHKRAYYQRNREAIRARQNARAAEERARARAARGDPRRSAA